MENKHKKYLIISLTIILFGAIILGAFRENYSYPWYFNKMNIRKSWTYSKGKNQIVALIDTGISNKLEKNIKSKIVYKYNVINDNKDVSDLHGHGTEMASIISGYDKLNLLGISPEAELIIIKAVSDEGKTNNSFLYKALKIAEEQNATVVNISLGGFKGDKEVRKQIKKMTDNNITIVCAAGDYGNKDLLFPASDSNVISAEACDEEMNLCDFSNRSEKSVALFPGNNIEAISINENGRLVKGKYSGTSEACSITSGYVALIKSYYISEQKVICNKDLIEILKESKKSNYDYMNLFLPKLNE